VKAALARRQRRGGGPHLHAVGEEVREHEHFDGAAAQLRQPLLVALHRVAAELILRRTVVTVRGQHLARHPLQRAATITSPVVSTASHRNCLHCLAQHGMVFNCDSIADRRGGLRRDGPFHLPCEPTRPLSLSLSLSLSPDISHAPSPAVHRGGAARVEENSSREQTPLGGGVASPACAGCDARDYWVPPYRLVAAEPAVTLLCSI
jgi:hypothetical protein